MRIGDRVKYAGLDCEHPYVGTVVKFDGQYVSVRIDPAASDMEYHHNPDFLTIGGRASIDHWVVIDSPAERHEITAYYDAITGVQQ